MGVYGRVNDASSGGDTKRHEQMGMPSVASDDLPFEPLGLVEKVYRTVSRDIRFLDSRGNGVLWPSNHGRAASESGGSGDADAAFGGGDDPVVAAAAVTSTSTGSNSDGRERTMPLVRNEAIAFIVSVSQGGTTVSTKLRSASPCACSSGYERHGKNAKPCASKSTERPLIEPHFSATQGNIHGPIPRRPSGRPGEAWRR